MNAELKVWREASATTLRPEWVLPRTLILIVLLPTALWATSGSRPPTAFELNVPHACGAATIAMIVSPLLFVVLDVMFDARAWGWLGALSPIISSTEREHHGAFVLRRMNTHSSHAQVGGGAYVLARAAEARAPLASAAFGVSLLALGVLSFCWWASRTRLAQKLDNLLMEAHLLALGVVALSVSRPLSEPALVGAVALAVIVRGATFSGQASLVVCFALEVAMIFAAARRLEGGGDVRLFAGGVGIVLLGLVCKAADAQGSAAWGTAAFHYAAGAGFGLATRTKPSLAHPSTLVSVLGLCQSARVRLPRAVLMWAHLQTLPELA